MKSISFSLFLALVVSMKVYAQDPYQDLNEGFRQFGEVMLATSGDVTALELARTNTFGANCNNNQNEPVANDIDLGLTPETDPKSKWRFSVMVTMGGPREGLQKHYANKDARYAEMGGIVDGLIGQNFSSYDARMAAVKQACQGLSEYDRISMASTLGSRLSDIYDYNRSDGDNNDLVVTPEDQWQAMHNRAGGNFSATSGVCRDASITVSQFLLACGFKPDQVSIEGYRTVGGGHQVTSVRTSDGEVYTINWSELYKSDEDAHTAPAPNPNLINTGLYYTVYDPQTGRVVERRRTELGEVLKAVTGGQVDDPNHLPQLIKLEAGYGVISANVFKTTTARGDFAQGVATYIKKDDILGFLDLSAGVAYVNNTREVGTSITNSSELNQNIVYGQIEGRFRIPELALINRDDRTLTLRPSAVISTEGYWSNDSQDGDARESNGDQFTQGRVGLDMQYRQDRFGAYVGGEVTGNLAERGFNNEQGTPGQNGSDGGYTPFVNTYNVHGGVTWDGDRMSLSGTGEYTIARSETRTALGVRAIDNTNNASYSAVYSVYNRTYGTREDFLVLRAEKDFEIQRVGTVNLGLQGQVPLAQNFNQAVVGVSVRFSPFSGGRR